MNTPSLKDLLERWTRPQKLPHPFDPRRTLKAAAEAAKALGECRVDKTAASTTLAILHRRVVESWRRNRSLSRIESRDLRRLPVGSVLPAKTKAHRLAGRGTTRPGSIRPLVVRRPPDSLRVGAAARVSARIPCRPADLWRFENGPV